MKVFIIADLGSHALEELEELGLCLFFAEEEGMEVVGTYEFCAWPSRGYFVKSSRDKHIYSLDEFTKVMPLGELYQK